VRLPTAFQTFVILASASVLIVFSCVGGLVVEGTPGGANYTVWIVGLVGGALLFAVGLLLAAFLIVRSAWRLMNDKRTADRQTGA
jgi:hypothetical protein